MENGKTPLGNNDIGEYYNTQNLESLTEGLSGTKVSEPYEPVFAKLTETAFTYPDLMIYVVRGDGHHFSMVRQNPTVDTRGVDRIASHQNP
jgi:hypothetical protein